MVIDPRCSGLDRAEQGVYVITAWICRNIVVSDDAKAVGIQQLAVAKFFQYVETST